MTKEKEMEISQTYRADSALREPKSALPGLMRSLGLALLACTLFIGVAEAQQAAPPIDGVIGKLQSFNGKALDVQTPSGVVHVTVKELGLKNVKAITRITYAAEEPRDYWAERGYSRYDGI